MVIQRWQSLLLLVAAVMMGCFTFMSLGQLQTTDFSFNFTTLGFSYEGEATDGAPEGTFMHTWYLFIISLTTSIVFLLDIFLFKNLPLQKKVCLVGILMTIASWASCFSLGYFAVEGGVIGWSAAVWTPVIVVFAAVMAYNRMSKDHNLLKSVDRIR